MWIGLSANREGASSLNYLIETPFQTRIVELLIINAEVSESELTLCFKYFYLYHDTICLCLPLEDCVKMPKGRLFHAQVNHVVN